MVEVQCARPSANSGTKMAPSLEFHRLAPPRVRRHFGHGKTLAGIEFDEKGKTRWIRQS